MLTDLKDLEELGLRYDKEVIEEIETTVHKQILTYALEYGESGFNSTDMYKRVSSLIQNELEQKTKILSQINENVIVNRIYFSVMGMLVSEKIIAPMLHRSEIFYTYYDL